MTQRFIPFGLIPRHWGLQGKEKRKAQAMYMLEGRDLELALADIEHEDRDSLEYKLAILDIDYKFRKLSENDYEKKKATLSDEPFFRVVGGDYNATGADSGTMIFELDWNEQFVDELRSYGWKGVTPDAIVDSWFEDACKQMFDEAALESENEHPVTAYNRTRRRPTDTGTTEYS